MGISRTQLIGKVKRRLGAPLVKVELCDDQIIDHIDYARKKFVKWAIGNATEEVYFTLLLQAGKRFYDLPVGVTDVISYDTRSRGAGINTLFTVENFLFQSGAFGTSFNGGYDFLSYHLALDFLTTLDRYTTTPYNFRYHKSTNQLEVSPTPESSSSTATVTLPHPETGIPTDFLVDSPGWLLIRSYMLQGSTLPNYTPEWRDVLKEKKTVVETKVINQQNIDSKSILLDHTPLNDTSDMGDVNIYEDTSVSVGTIDISKGTDWNFHPANSRVITWDGLGLDGIISVGDVVNVTYPVVFESKYYPDEWDTVTATSTEIEQYILTDSDVANGRIILQKPIHENNVKVAVGYIENTLNSDYIIDPQNPRIIKWKGLPLDGVVTTGDKLVVTYVTVTSKQPSNASTSFSSSIKQYTTKIENRALTATEITNGQLVLTDVASVVDGVKMSIGGLTRVNGVDFVLSGDNQTIDWNGYGLDGVVVEGENVVVTYTSATPMISELAEDIYDNDWIIDYVTALSKITLGMVRRKFANFASMGGSGISMDGDSLISEGNTEKEQLEETLRNEEAYEGLGIIIGTF